MEISTDNFSFSSSLVLVQGSILSKCYALQSKSNVNLLTSINICLMYTSFIVHLLNRCIRYYSIWLFAILDKYITKLLKLVTMN